MILYNIYHFIFDKLWSDKIENNTLICDEYRTKIAKNITGDGIDKRKINLLFDQTIKAFDLNRNDSDIFKDKFIILDFNGTDNIANKLMKIENGIRININGNTYTYKLFLKSNSMSKKSMVLFAKTEDDFYYEISKRVTFNLDGYANKNNIEYKSMVISKWFAYSGTVLSDCFSMLQNTKLLDDFKNNKIVVIPDEKRDSIREVPLITAISEKSIWDSIINIQKLENKNKLVEAERLKSQTKDLFDKYKRALELKKLNDNGQRIYTFLVDCIKYINLTGNEKSVQHNKLQNVVSECTVGEIYWESIKLEDKLLEVNLFDGEGLISPKLAEEINAQLIDDKVIKENNKQYSFQIRLPFVKGVVHTCDFKKFFKDNGVDVIKCLTFNPDGKDKDKNVNINDVEVILTESQFKAASFINSIEKKDNESNIDAYFRMLDKYNYWLGISGIEPTEYYEEELAEEKMDDEIDALKNDRIVRLNGQFFTTIPFDKETMYPIINKNKQLIENISDDFVFKSILKDKIKYTDTNNRFGINNNKGEYSTLQQNYRDLFTNLDVYSETKKELVNKYKKDMLQLKLWCRGARLFLSGDLLHLLYYSAGLNNNDCLGYEEYYASSLDEKFNNVLLLRNPHYSRNEIGFLKRLKEDKKKNYDKYFSCLNNVIMVNPLSGISDRCGGADYDGDNVVVISPSLVKKIITKLFLDNKPKYPIIKIPSVLADKKENNFENISICMQNTFDSRVGLISNNALQDSFIAYYLNDSIEAEEKILDKMALYTILAGLEIDSAKTGIKPQLIGIDNKVNDSKKIKNYKTLNNILKISTNAPGKIFIAIRDILKGGDNSVSKSIPKNIYSAIKNYVSEKNINNNVFFILNELTDKFNRQKFGKIDKRPIDKTIKYCEANDEKTSKIISTIILYNQYKKAFFSHKQYLLKKNSTTASVINDLERIFNAKNSNISYSDFVDSINLDNARELYSKDIRYQFVDNELDRRSQIEDVFEIDNVDEYIDVSSDFTKKGNYLLYLALVLKNCFAKSYKLSEISFDNEIGFYIETGNKKEKKCIVLFNDYCIKSYSKDMIDNIVNNCNKYVNDINKIIDNEDNYKFNDIISKTINNELKNSDIKDYINSLRLSDSILEIFNNEDYVFSFYLNSLFNYLDDVLGGE